MKIAVVGTGYVGLVTGTCFAETGNDVVCVDIDEAKVAKMRNGEVPIYEPHLDVLFERNIKANRLRFTTELAEAIKDAEIIFLALPTPPGEDGSADLSYILGVAEQLGEMITDYKVIVDKSTVPVGTAEKVTAAIAQKTTVEFDVVSNPEFLREGFAVDDFLKPDRVVIGTTSEKAREVMNRLYKPFVRQGNPIIFMDEKSAELTKYAANSFLATKITFMNEIANYCELIGADVDAVRRGMGTDTRIGNRFLFPGIGYGGSCFPKDVQALVKSGKEVNFNFEIIDSVMDVNHRQKLTLAEKVKKYFGNDLKGKKLALWGLAFKPDTDDIREAPALYMIDELTKSGAEICAFDPEAMDNVKGVKGDLITYASNLYEALEGADALLIATEWSVFRTPDFERIDKALKNKVIFDGRNLYDLKDMEKRGYYYESIGRLTVK
ncbi:MAG: UDP-glucose/GDP-mannose dehydrogenase family protein [Flavobacteriales bacterium]|jgi:UDPglucose 6-dehydrogenase|nr:UDP-glucose/GDP-mannose dehydrogenase family protein [Flavobacteriales bacterium]